MARARLASLLAYRPDPVAVRRRMVAEAAELYAWGLTAERHQPTLTDYAGQLRKFYLYPTFACPLRCPYCYAEGGTRHVDELDASAFLRMTAQAMEAGFESVVLVGGEPLVYYDFDRYVKGLLDLRASTCTFVLRTSFSLDVSNERMERVCHAFDELVVSIDGDERTHDALRGQGSWAQATRNARRAVGMGARVSVNAVLSEAQNEGEAGAFLRAFCEELGIRKLVVSSPVPMGRAAKTRVPYFEWRSGQAEEDVVRPSFSCGLGHSLYVQPDGSVFACYAWCEREHQLGDLSRESLRDILARPELLGLMNSGVDTNRKCRTCEVRYFCGGKCKIWVADKSDVDSGDFDCTATKESLLAALRRHGVLDAE